MLLKCYPYIILFVLLFLFNWQQVLIIKNFFLLSKSVTSHQPVETCHLHSIYVFLTFGGTFDYVPVEVVEADDQIACHQE